MVDLVIEDGTCVTGANSFNTIQEGRNYFSGRIRGEKWDLAHEGQNWCDEDICAAYLAAIDYMRIFDWNTNACCENTLPSPVDCGCCNGCKSGPLPALKEAQLIIADAILRGWEPFSSADQSSQVWIKSRSFPDEGSVTYAQPVTKQQLGMTKTKIDIGDQVVARLEPLLRCFLGMQEPAINILA